MERVLIVVLETAGVGAAVGGSVYWIQRLLIQRGIVRYGQLGAPIFAVMAVLARQIWFAAAPWWFYAPFVVLASVVGTNRADLWTTANRGRWWWKSNKDNRL